MHMYIRNQLSWISIKWTLAEQFEMNAKVGLVLNFVVDKESRLDA